MGTTGERGGASSQVKGQGKEVRLMDGIEAQRVGKKANEDIWALHNFQVWVMSNQQGQAVKWVRNHAREQQGQKLLIHEKQ